MIKQRLLEQALAAVKERGESYGSVKDNFQRIADNWNLWLYHRGIISELGLILPRDVAMMCDKIKDARLVETPDHWDSVVDKAGYSGCYAECITPPPNLKETEE